MAGQKDWRQRMQRFDKQAGGLMAVFLHHKSVIYNDSQPEIDMIRRFILNWMDEVPKIHPVCLACDHCWTNYEQPPPEGYVIARPAVLTTNAAGFHCVMVGVCENCFTTRTRTDLINVAFSWCRELWPDLRVVANDVTPGHG